MHFSHCALNREGFLEAADGMKRAAVKLEENLGENQIDSEAKEGASSQNQPPKTINLRWQSPRPPSRVERS